VRFLDPEPPERLRALYDRGNRWVLAAFAVLGVLGAYLPALTDRLDVWTLDGDAVRWTGVILYILGIGSVKGFAFTLGLTTVIDIIVVFLFTKPLITILARTEFFGGGHKWSGLDPERLGGTKATYRSGGSGGRRVTIAERRKAAEQAGDVDSDDTKRVDV